MKVKLGDIFQISSGGTPDRKKTEYYEKGTIPWIKTGDLQNTYISDNVEKITQLGLDNSSAKLFPKGTVLLAMYGATIGACSILPYEASTNQACAAFLPTEEVIPEYLLYFLKSKKKKFINDGVGGAQPNISAGYLKNIEFSHDTIGRQKEVVASLIRVEKIITKRQQQLSALDDLIKARFVEMFGDPVHNPVKLPTLPMTEVCEIIDGDRGKNYPTQEEFFDEGYCLFLNAKNVTKQGFNFSDCMFITKEKDATLRKGKLQRGDVVLTTRGTLGNLAFYTEEIPFENVRINSGMVILRMNRAIIDETFFIEQFRMQLDDIKATIASGSAQPQLPISTMNKISLLMPELEEQQKFAAFVTQIDKSKAAIRKSLDETQLLFDNLMQQYFG